MNSDPKRATSCRDPLLKNVRNVINLCLDPKMRSTPEVSSIEVMFSAHGDSVWPMPPPRTFSVGFEEQIVVGSRGHVFYVCRPQNGGKIVISDFVKNNKPHIFTPPLPSGRGGVKIWGLLFS